MGHDPRRAQSFGCSWGTWGSSEPNRGLSVMSKKSHTGGGNGEEEARAVVHKKSMNDPFHKSLGPGPGPTPECGSGVRPLENRPDLSGSLAKVLKL